MSSPKTIHSPSEKLDSIPFEDFEVHGAIRRGHCILVPDEQAEYWTVLGYLCGKRACGIGRFESRSEAEAFSSTLARYSKDEPQS